MSRLSFFVVFAFLFSFGPSAFAQNCAPTEALRKYISYIKAYELSPLAWPGYSLTQYPHIVADLKTAPHCVFLIQNGKLKETIVTKDPAITLIISDADLEKMIPPGLPIDQHDKVMAFLRSSFLTPAWTGIQTNPDRDTNVKWDSLLVALAKRYAYRDSLFYVGIHDFNQRQDEIAGLAHHEAFHHFFQNALDNSPKRWPAWDEQPDRNNMGKVCYGVGLGNDLEKIYRSEKQAVLAAVEAMQNGDEKITLEKTSLFIQFRKQRYQLLERSGIRVVRGIDFVSCEEAEAVMELEEGTAFFVEATADLAAGVLPPKDLVKTFLSTPPDFDPFYVLGASEIFLLSRTVGLKRLQSDFAKSTSWRKGIFSYF